MTRMCAAFAVATVVALALPCASQASIFCEAPSVTTHLTRTKHLQIDFSYAVHLQDEVTAHPRIETVYIDQVEKDATGAEMHLGRWQKELPAGEVTNTEQVVVSHLTLPSKRWRSYRKRMAHGRHFQITVAYRVVKNSHHDLCAAVSAPTEFKRKQPRW